MKDDSNNEGTDLATQPAECLAAAETADGQSCVTMLINVLKIVESEAEPEDEGFCKNGCSKGNQMPLIKDTVTYDNGVVGDRYRWQHDPHCWYGKVRAVLAEIDR